MMDTTNQTALRMGYAQADITPAGPVITIGFGREDQLSRGVRKPLSAQVTVWQLGEERCCLAAIDHIGLGLEHARALRDGLGEALGISREKVMLCFSHTHAAPNDSEEPAYLRLLCERVLAAAAEAAGKMAPACAGWGNGHTAIGVNRRADSTQLDDRLGILKVTDPATGELRLLLLRLTAHANVLKGDNWLISPDYFGAVRELLGRQYRCPVVVTQGASGNVAPRYFCSEETPPDAVGEAFRRSATALEDMAQTVLRDARPVIDRIRPQGVERLAAFVRTVELTAQVPSYERALEIADEARRFCNMDGTAWLAEVRRLLDAGIHRQIESVEVQYFLLGEGCLCGVPNEVMCEFALRAAAQVGSEYLYFGGYTNGCGGYFPTEEEFDLGGYEVYWSLLLYFPYFGRVFPLRRESAGRLIDFVAANSPL